MTNIVKRLREKIAYEQELGLNIHYFHISELELVIAEIEKLRLDVEMLEALNVSAYKAGLKQGWNYCDANDQKRFAESLAGTDHIAELKRIREARRSLAESK